MKYNENLAQAVEANGYEWLRGAGLDLRPEEAQGLEELPELWNNLVLDPYLKVEGTARLRRYSKYDLSGDGGLTRLPHEPYRQAAEHNPLFGDQDREFEPCPPELDENPYFLGLAGLIRQALPTTPSTWRMYTHMVRIQVNDGGSAQPVPEGAHRDGFDYIAIHMIGRTGVSGGESTIYESGKAVATATLREAGDGLILDDRRFTHNTTPISIVDGADDGTRDVFLFSFDPATDQELGASSPAKLN